MCLMFELEIVFFIRLVILVLNVESYLKYILFVSFVEIVFCIGFVYVFI